MKLEIPDSYNMPAIMKALDRAGMRFEYSPEAGGLRLDSFVPNLEYKTTWRPVSNPPDTLVDVLVTVLDHDQKPTVEMAYMRGCEWILTGEEIHIKPLAWRYIPDPFDGGQDGN